MKNNLTCAGFPQLPYEFARDALSNHLRASHSQAQELKAMRAEHERLKYKIPGIEFWEGLYQKYSSAERRRLYATDYEQLLEGSRLTRDGHDQASELPAMYASKERLAGQIDRLSEKIAGQIWPKLKAMSRAQLQNRAFWVRDQSAKDHFWVRDRGRQVRDRSPPHTPADGHHRCFWLRHRSKRAQCARRHQASTPVRRAASCADGFLWLSSRAFCDPAGGRICVV